MPPLVDELLAEAEARRAVIFGRRSGPAVDHDAVDYERYAHAFDSCIQRGDAERAARFIVALRDFWWARGQYEEGLAWIDKVLAVPDLSAACRATVLDHAGALAFADRQYSIAQAFFEASLDLRRRSDDKPGLALTLNHLAAVVRWGRNDSARAKELYEESLALARETGDRLLVAAALMPLGTQAIHQGAVAQARAFLVEGLSLYVELRVETAYPLALEQFAALAAECGQATRALRLAAAGAAWRRQLDTYPTPYTDWLEGYVGRAREALDPSAALAAWAEGEALPLDVAIGSALQEEVLREGQ